MQNMVLKVQGMSCGHCVRSIEGALGELGAQGKADLAAGEVAIQYDETKLSLEQVKEAIEDQGYEVV